MYLLYCHQTIYMTITILLPYHLFPACQDIYEYKPHNQFILNVFVPLIQLYINYEMIRCVVIWYRARSQRLICSNTLHPLTNGQAECLITLVFTNGNITTKGHPFAKHYDGFSNKNHCWYCYVRRKRYPSVLGEYDYIRKL